jgi:hypothetical protein
MPKTTASSRQLTIFCMDAEVEPGDGGGASARRWRQTSGEGAERCAGEAPACEKWPETGARHIRTWGAAPARGGGEHGGSCSSEG